uniref:Uncharacterized protein n=1 Tax=Anguilla anguilla TaxID=7936 RepID=A0A0E9UT28_ANGAN
MPTFNINLKHLNFLKQNEKAKKRKTLSMTAARNSPISN